MMPNGNVLSFVMAGGRGSRLKVLTKSRAKPAVGILGHHCIFDFVATNVVNSGITTTLVATQFQAQALNTKIGTGEIWGFDGYSKRLELVKPEIPGKGLMTFDGTADCVRKSANQINKYRPEVILILGADHIYSMNYKFIIDQHKSRKADITIMTNSISEEKVNDFGLVKIDDHGRILDFVEKPTDPKVIADFRLSDKIKKRLGITRPELNFLASMGNYVFYWDKLKKFLDFPGIDFGRDIIPAIKENGGALYAHNFNGYWRDVGKIKDYFNCNMEFTQGKPPIDLLNYQLGKYNSSLHNPKIASGAFVKGTIISAGDMISFNSSITNSVLGHQVLIEEGCRLDHCILLGADRSKTRYGNRTNNYSTRVEKNASLSYVILDDNVLIGKGVDISPKNGTPQQREELLQSVGLKPYIECADGTIEGDYYLDHETGILAISARDEDDSPQFVFPEGFRC